MHKSVRKSPRKSHHKRANKSPRKSPRKSHKKRPSKMESPYKNKTCKERLSQKIAINMKEGYKSRAQAIAVAYSQINKMFPHCKPVLAKK
jgi:hypothetical protein